jgi:hypothetical protein
VWLFFFIMLFFCVLEYQILGFAMQLNIHTRFLF